MMERFIYFVPVNKKVDGWKKVILDLSNVRSVGLVVVLIDQ